MANAETTLQQQIRLALGTRTDLRLFRNQVGQLPDPRTGRPVQLVSGPEVGVPRTGVVNEGETRSAFVATAVAILANSVLISVPLTIFSGSPGDRESFVAKLVL